MCEIALSKSTEREKKWLHDISVERLCDLSCHCHCRQYCKEIFWKEQFDTFENRCNVLRAAFCDFRDVSYSLTHSINLHDLFFRRSHDFFCEQVAWFFCWEIASFFSVKKLHDFLCEEVDWFFCVFFLWKKGVLWTIFLMKKVFSVTTVTTVTTVLWRGCMIFFGGEVT